MRKVLRKGPSRGWIRREIEALTKLEKECRANDLSRTWYVDYVVAIHKLYKELQWRKSVKHLFYAQIEKDSGRKQRRGRHPLLILFEATSSVSPKMQSRWSNALQYADRKWPNATEAELKKFIRTAKGGMARLEKRLAAIKKRTS